MLLAIEDVTSCPFGAVEDDAETPLRRELLLLLPSVVRGICCITRRLENAGVAFFEEYEKLRRCSADGGGSSDTQKETLREGGCRKNAGKSSGSKDANSGHEDDTEYYVDESWRRKSRKRKDGSSSSQQQHSARKGFTSLRDLIDSKDNLYERLQVSEGATVDDIKKAYRRLALLLHPDKQLRVSEQEEPEGSKGSEIGKAQEFVRLQEAYELLSDKEFRLQYDSALPFDDSIPSAAQAADPRANFFDLFAGVFARNAKWSVRRPCPQLGSLDTPSSDVRKFYDFWMQLESWRDFAVHDEYDLQDADSREERRWMERQNLKSRRQYIKAENARIQRLVDLAYSNDPRIRAEKEQEKAKRQEEARKKRAVIELQQQLKRQEAEEQRRAEEERARLVREAAQREAELKQAEKARTKKWRQRLRLLTNELLELYRAGGPSRREEGGTKHGLLGGRIECRTHEATNGKRRTRTEEASSLPYSPADIQEVCLHYELAELQQLCADLYTALGWKSTVPFANTVSGVLATDSGGCGREEQLRSKAASPSAGSDATSTACNSEATVVIVESTSGMRLPTPPNGCGTTTATTVASSLQTSGPSSADNNLSSSPSTATGFPQPSFERCTGMLLSDLSLSSTTLEPSPSAQLPWATCSIQQLEAAAEVARKKICQMQHDREQTRLRKERAAKESLSTATPSASSKVCDWTVEELSLLAKGLQKYPGGTPRRWHLIASLIGGTKSSEEVVDKAKLLAEGTSLKTMGSSLNRVAFDQFVVQNKGAFKEILTQPDKRDPQDSIDMGTTANHTSAAASHCPSGENAGASEAQPRRVEVSGVCRRQSSAQKKSPSSALELQQEEVRSRGGGAKEEKNKHADATSQGGRSAAVAQQEKSARDGLSNDWTDEQQKNLESCLTKFPASMDPSERWTAIAKHVPGKTKKECLLRFKEIRAAIIARKASQAEPPS